MISHKLSASTTMMTTMTMMGINTPDLWQHHQV